MENDTDQIKAAMDRMAKQLIELHGCDSVRLFATKRIDGDQTASITSGSGNFYAQMGQTGEWLAAMTSQEPPEDSLV